MNFSRPFRALLKLAGLWSIPWAMLGVVVAVIRWVSTPAIPSTVSSLGSWILNHALGYGAVGAISGLYLGLLLAWVAHGRRADEISARHLALWSGLAGAVPAVLFAGLGLLFGAPSTAYLPLAGLGIFNAVVSGSLVTTALVAAQRRVLSKPDALPTLGARS